ncbi:MAG: hypothetical protein EBS06_00315 [Proteobacteria bacterium]|nr:hypothetical protein [Pseudomonadota bacterium]
MPRNLEYMEKVLRDLFSRGQESGVNQTEVSFSEIQLVINFDIEEGDDNFIKLEEIRSFVEVLTSNDFKNKKTTTLGKIASFFGLSYLKKEGTAPEGTFFYEDKGTKIKEEFIEKIGLSSEYKDLNEKQKVFRTLLITLGDKLYQNQQETSETSQQNDPSETPINLPIHYYHKVKKEEAATKIQALGRGRLGRLKAERKRSAEAERIDSGKAEKLRKQIYNLKSSIKTSSNEKKQNLEKELQKLEKELQKLEAAVATKIQAAYRGKFVRSEAERKRLAEEERKRLAEEERKRLAEEAATKIQAWYRKIEKNLKDSKLKSEDLKLLKERLKKANDEIERLKNQLAENLQLSASEIEEIKKSLTGKEEEIKSLKQELDKYQKVLEELQLENLKLKQKLEDEIRQKREDARKLKTLEDFLVKTQSEISTILSQGGSLPLEGLSVNPVVVGGAGLSQEAINQLLDQNKEHLKKIIKAAREGINAEQASFLERLQQQLNLVVTGEQLNNFLQQIQESIAATNLAKDAAVYAANQARDAALSLNNARAELELANKAVNDQLTLAQQSVQDIQFLAKRAQDQLDEMIRLASEQANQIRNLAGQTQAQIRNTNAALNDFMEDARADIAEMTGREVKPKITFADLAKRKDVIDIWVPTITGGNNINIKDNIKLKDSGLLISEYEGEGDYNLFMSQFRDTNASLLDDKKKNFLFSVAKINEIKLQGTYPGSHFIAMVSKRGVTLSIVRPEEYETEIDRPIELFYEAQKKSAKEALLGNPFAAQNPELPNFLFLPPLAGSNAEVDVDFFKKARESAKLEAEREFDEARVNDYAEFVGFINDQSKKDHFSKMLAEKRFKELRAGLIDEATGDLKESLFQPGHDQDKWRKFSSERNGQGFASNDVRNICSKIFGLVDNPSAEGFEKAEKIKNITNPFGDNKLQLEEEFFSKPLNLDLFLGANQDKAKKLYSQLVRELSSKSGAVGLLQQYKEKNYDTILEVLKEEKDRLDKETIKLTSEIEARLKKDYEIVFYKQIVGSMLDDLPTKAEINDKNFNHNEFINKISVYSQERKESIFGANFDAAQELFLLYSSRSVNDNQEIIEICSAIADLFDLDRPTKQKMERLLAKGDHAEIEAALFKKNDLGKYDFRDPFLFGTSCDQLDLLNQSKDETRIQDLINKGWDALRTGSTHPATQAIKDKAILQDANKNKSGDLSRKVSEIEEYKKNILTSEFPENIKSPETNIAETINNLGLTDKVAQAIASKNSAAYASNFIEHKINKTIDKTVEALNLSVEAKEALANGDKKLARVLDIDLPIPALRGVSFLNKNRDQISVVFNSSKDDVAWVHIPGTNQAYVRAVLCTEYNMGKPMQRSLPNGEVETYYEKEILRNGKPFLVECRPGDVLMDEGTVHHRVTDGKGNMSHKAVDVSQESVISTGAAARLAKKTFNLGINTVTLGAAKLTNSNFDSRTKANQEFGDDDFKTVQKRYKEVQILAMSVDDKGQRSVATFLDGKANNHAFTNRGIFYKKSTSPWIGNLNPYGLDGRGKGEVKPVLQDMIMVDEKGKKLEFVFDDKGNLTGGQIREDENRKSYRDFFVEAEGYSIKGADNADLGIKFYGRISTLDTRTHPNINLADQDEDITEVGDVELNKNIFFEDKTGKKIAVFEEETTILTEEFKQHVSDKMTLEGRKYVSDNDLEKEANKLLKKFKENFSVEVSVKTAAAEVYEVTDRGSLGKFSFSYTILAVCESLELAFLKLEDDNIENSTGQLVEKLKDSIKLIISLKEVIDKQSSNERLDRSAAIKSQLNLTNDLKEKLKEVKSSRETLEPRHSDMIINRALNVAGRASFGRLVSTNDADQAEQDIKRAKQLKDALLLVDKAQKDIENLINAQKIAPTLNLTKKEKLAPAEYKVDLKMGEKAQASSILKDGLFKIMASSDVPDEEKSSNEGSFSRNLLDPTKRKPLEPLVATIEELKAKEDKEKGYKSLGIFKKPSPSPKVIEAKNLKSIAKERQGGSIPGQ